MNQNQKQKPKRKSQGAAVAAVLCFVAAIAIVGTYTFKDYRDTQRELAKAEESGDVQDGTKEGTKEIPQAEETTTDLIINEAPKEDAEEEPETVESAEDTDAQESGDAQNAEAAAGQSKSVNFNENSKLLWPVNGNVLLNYSMDKTVYFSTLDQYKYNPALIISGAEGDQVICGAPGIVKSIDKTAETGTTVNVDLGSGYELFYGQLKDVPLNAGDYVEAKTVLGYVSQPTKYYSVEGSNVYFEMRKDGQPVNPMEYLVE